MAEHRRFQLGAAFLLVVTAVAVWAYWLWPFGAMDAESLRQVEPIDVQITSVRVFGGMLKVGCRIHNRGPREADHIVLTARLKDRRGNVVAVNPLASVADVAPGTTCDTEITIPAGSNVAQCQAEVEPTLVRWANE